MTTNDDRKNCKSARSSGADGKAGKRIDPLTELRFLRLVIDDRHLTATDIRVARHIIKHFNVANGYAYPVVETLAESARVATSTAAQSIRRLCDPETGYFFCEIGGGRGRSNRYFPRFKLLDGAPLDS